MTDSPLNVALRQFDANEANLVKSEKVLAEIEAIITQGIIVGGNPEYETNRRSFYALWASLQKIDNWKPDIALMELDEIAQPRCDAQKFREIERSVLTESKIVGPSELLREYRY